MNIGCEQVMAMNQTKSLVNNKVLSHSGVIKEDFMTNVIKKFKFKNERLICENKSWNFLIYAAMLASKKCLKNIEVTSCIIISYKMSRKEGTINARQKDKL